MKLSEIYGVLFTIGLLTGCASNGSARIDNVPMYGQPQVERPAILKKADEDFIREASTGLVSREAASKAWFNQGNEYMAEGNLDYSMRRYNQSWLLNPENYQPYWGFARVMVAKRQYEESFKYFDKAKELVNDPYQKPALLSDFAVAYHNKANALPRSEVADRKKYFDLANRTFEESTNADPTYFNAWFKWAYSLYFQENYSESWSKVKKARELDTSAIPDAFIADLRSKMPEPAN